MKVAFQPELCTSLVGNSQHASSHHHEASCRANLAMTWSHHTTLLCVARSWDLNPSPEFSCTFLGQPRDFQSKFSFEVTSSSIHICTICIYLYSVYTSCFHTLVQSCICVPSTNGLCLGVLHEVVPWQKHLQTSLRSKENGHFSRQIRSNQTNAVVGCLKLWYTFYYMEEYGGCHR